MNVYLAGPITGCSYKETTDWRNYAIKELSAHRIEAFSPMRGKDFLLDEKAVADCYDESIRATSKVIAKRDKWDCKRCDVFLANLLNAKKVSIGTMIEFGWASDPEKPIITVMEDDNIHQHSIVRELSLHIVPTLDQAIAEILILDKSF